MNKFYSLTVSQHTRLDLVKLGIDAHCEMDEVGKLNTSGLFVEDSQDPTHVVQTSTFNVAQLTIIRLFFQEFT
jgi:hypothetical protein